MRSSKTRSTPRDLRYALAEADASFKSIMQARGTDCVALSNGRGQIARSPTAEEVNPLNFHKISSLASSYPSNTTVTTRLLRRGGRWRVVCRVRRGAQRGGRCRRRHNEISIRVLAFVFGGGAGTSARATRGCSVVQRTVRQRPRALVLFPISLGGIGAPTRLEALEPDQNPKRIQTKPR